MRATPLLLPILALASLPAVARADLIQARDGEHEEQVLTISPEAGGLLVRTAQRALPLADVKAIRFQDEAAPGQKWVKVILINGDWLRGRLLAGNGQTITLETRLGGREGALEIALDDIRAVLFDPSAEDERRLEAKLTAQEEDEVHLRNPAGTARGYLKALSPSEVVIEELQVQADLPFATAERVEMVAVGVVKKAAPLPPDQLVVALRLVDGSRLRGVLEGMDKRDIRLTHLLAGEAKVLTLPRSALSQLSVENGSFVYLSDMEPANVEQGFPFGVTYDVDLWGYKRDAAVDGSPLRLGGRTHGKGLGVHSYCALDYQLGKRYSEFRAVIGLDDQTRWRGGPHLGAIVFKVLVDGKPAAEYPNGIEKRKGEAPTAVKVSVKGASSLRLVADYDPISLHILGRGDWADAHLIK